MSFLSVDHVTKIYRSGNPFRSRETMAVNDISFEIRQGECLAVVGESGSGKSTLGRMLIGLEPATRGRILFRGQNVFEACRNLENRRALQMVYQNSSEAVNPRFSAAEIVEEPLKYFHLVPKEDLWDKEKELLEKVGIPESEMGKKAGSFSGGQLQRICIARALAAKPEMLLLDEPLSSLDVSVQAQILNLLRELKEEYRLTYLLISHDLEVVYYLADRLVVMYFGRQVERLDDMEKFDTLVHPYTLDLLQAAACRTGGGQYGGARYPAEQGCIYAERCQKACSRCRQETPELREMDKDHWIACHFYEK